MKDNVLLSVKNLSVKFKTLDGMNTIIEGNSFDVKKGEVLCMVGESGCGKSLTSLAIMGLIELYALIKDDGALMSENAVRLFAERGGAVVATFSPALPYFKLPPEITKLGEDCAYNSEIVLNGMKDAAHQAADNGVAVGMGTDASCPFCTQYGSWREVVYFNRAGGFTPEQSLYTATLGNAKVLRIDSETGSVAKGKSADIIFTKGNPVADLTELSRVFRVIAQGRDIAKPTVKRNKKIDKLLDDMIAAL